MGGSAGRVGPVRPSLDTMASKGLWPTPTVCGNYNKAGLSKSSGDGLATAVARSLLPSPRASDATRGPGLRKDRTKPDNLATAVKMLPTPTCNDAKNNGAASQHERNSPPLNAIAGGPLNPAWVEWLMGFPLGYTDCVPSAMQLCPRSPTKSGSGSGR